jgi:HD-GYP domain-containing protein (c-di-GMP phosphodiesterase class II)
MKSHPAKTKEILDKFHFPKLLRNVPTISALHHERIDGTGYPNGLTDSDIPLEAKILSVADVFDALTSLRDYPKHDDAGKDLECETISVAQAVNILEKGAGSHFDAAVVAALKKCLTNPETQG